MILSLHPVSPASVLWSGGALGHGGIPDVTTKKRRRCPDGGTWAIPRWWPEGGADREGMPHGPPLCSHRWVSVGNRPTLTFEKLLRIKAKWYYNDDQITPLLMLPLNYNHTITAHIFGIWYQGASLDSEKECCFSFCECLHVWLCYLFFF